ncbi:acetyl-CoA carboxylase carboxyltransferase subunit alpha [Alphaproteobacteria bacterium]|jgi:acetyl-CoA carboxylase carboxyl transferase subunit alpha|uniref:acetyl-CoA carboxylase carboxyltransferase subunit alpha n=1 Tax=Candidatus Levibacter sp. Uisw_134_01 TaxID=3230999 RepID=UPI001D51B2DD|nr:acetyl-CoA carboxylase carboxyltransferase subunit alpha [Alphaproteobacteria bacterium]MDA7545294.1 acetyl-CoA carboxylase carboxyltransferase subunit alpha [Alphaproteobacteria bacterium]MDA9565422.1 acetyl-CoA carboxylase carboxyltransferase subunit alpha [Alphaproteobacteria bacterium]MDB2697068.1 acetyl-CoA carboxylase carboxyltransferase subunit alpha [Alphaproteobacteria bacterium]MDC0543837.1 acetyl-CoA carboxylase carboxyltransferase subunit alpha [Alphaproteobacteria bacterium]
MIKHFLSFEKQVSDLEGKIEELRHLSSGADINIAEEIGKLQGAVSEELRSTYSKLTAWQKVQVARHPERPHFEDILNHLMEDYTPLSGDRNFADDNALTGGTAFFRGRSVVVIGIDKGKDTNDRILKNFGMARPEGYRKAIRLMQLADQFSLPILMFVDTAGAYPGKGAEERGQAEAIARCIQKSLQVSVPTISVITGEGGSGGAVALAVANNTLMLEHAIYSVISPEGCSSILWRSSENANHAAEALKLTAQDMQKFNIIDEIIPEPTGGAHRDPHLAIKKIGDAIENRLINLLSLQKDELLKLKEEKYLKIS